MKMIEKTPDLLSLADENLSPNPPDHNSETLQHGESFIPSRISSGEPSKDTESEAHPGDILCCAPHVKTDLKDDYSLLSNNVKPVEVTKDVNSDSSLHCNYSSLRDSETFEESNGEICSSSDEYNKLKSAETRICVSSETADSIDQFCVKEKSLILESENKSNGGNGEADKITHACENLDKREVHLECEQIKKLKDKADPFELFSDDDSEPRRYQPIKRKLTPSFLTKDQSSDQSNSDTPKNAVSMTMEIADCKRMKMSGRVVYVHSDKLLQRVNQLTRIEGRADLVHSLIQAYGLLQYVDVTEPRQATETEILGFHSSDYIEFLKDVSGVSDVEGNKEDPHTFYSEAETYGLSYDCPLQDEIFETASLISGASIVAAESLISGQADMAVNWYGGWHHAKRDSASGFCYINDIVLAILKLREKFDRVLYVDIDLHHGDGVEEAFSLTSKVMTVSFHKYASGFFPGSGSVSNVGERRGQFYTVNVPLQDGIKDAEFCSVFFRVMKKVKERFCPEAVVIQCGADGLSEDPMASFNLTHIGLTKCVCFVLAWNLPTLLLGGGGYNFASTAKCWTFLTALVARRKLPLDIPEHENLLAYGPDYQLTTTVGNRRDCNSKQYLVNLLAKIFRNLEKIQPPTQHLDCKV